MYNYIGIPLDKLLSLEALKGARVLAGSRGMSRRITKVNVMEVPDILEWVSEGELLITAAYSIKDNIEILLELIPKLNDKGVAALGIKVGRYVKNLPEDIIELAEELGFPILELPFCTSHTEIISSILTEVINDQMNLLKRIDKFNSEMMDIVIKGGSLKEISHKLYESIGNSVAIYENVYNKWDLLCPLECREGMEELLLNHIGKHTCSQNSTFTDEINNVLVERVVIPIIIEKVQRGFIFVWLDHKKLSPLENMFIESYVHIIALEVVKSLALYNIENNYKQEFIDDLISGNSKRMERACERAKSFRFKRDLKYSVVTILLKEVYNSKGLTLKDMNEIQEYISYLMYLIAKHAPVKENIIFTDKSDRIIILYGCERHRTAVDIKSEIMGFCNKIMNDALRKLKVSSLIAGIGRVSEGLDKLEESYNQSKLIVESLWESMPGKVLHYDDAGLYRILCHEALQNELEKFCQEMIRPLIDYDKENNAELIRTLRAYFKYDGNVKRISEKMYVHYNTILYRLQKIKDITGLNLEDSDTRLSLQIALKTVELLNGHINGII